MTAYSREEEEQLEELKKWWSKYRNPVIYGLLVGVVAIFGTRSWFTYQSNQAISASNEYEQLQIELQQGNADAVSKRGAYLIDTYPKSPYAALAAFALARDHAERDELPAARERLQWVIDHARQPEFVHVARLRLGRLLLAMGESGQVLALIEPVKPEGYVSRYEELKGDAYAETGQPDKARRAYQQALDKLGPTADTQALRIKLNNLGVGDGNRSGDDR